LTGIRWQKNRKRIASRKGQKRGRVRKASPNARLDPVVVL